MPETGCDTRPHGDTPAFPMNEHLYYVPGTLPLPFLNITSTKGRALVGGAAQMWWCHNCHAIKGVVRPMLEFQLICGRGRRLPMCSIMFPSNICHKEAESPSSLTGNAGRAGRRGSGLGIAVDADPEDLGAAVSWRAQPRVPRPWTRVEPGQGGDTRPCVGVEVSSMASAGSHFTVILPLTSAHIW